MSEPIEEGAPGALESPAVDETPRYLIGVRLREPLLADDYQTTDPDLPVGDFVLVETGGAPVLGEVRRPGIADLFVAVMGNPESQAKGAAR